MLDRFTNQDIGWNQMRPQIKDLPDGNPLKIDIRVVAR
ncbi:hypothetical protein QFZ22_006848 [Streptomyces canus]|uniref:Uncharacterized protein n=1 Tax=Streptomyces canus TaxID=58343 RepID=A0AAW8FMU3_9ACTN|nr:hypothetical protein [Streptomyces canus]MDQ0910863.1 hypothetical protein [Streptomyces canus]